VIKEKRGKKKKKEKQNHKTQTHKEKPTPDSQSKKRSDLRAKISQTRRNDVRRAPTSHRPRYDFIFQ